LTLKASGADVVILILYPKPTAILLRDSLKLGYNPTWLGPDTISGLKTFGEQVGLPGALDHFITASATRFDPDDPNSRFGTSVSRSSFRTMSCRHTTSLGSAARWSSQKCSSGLARNSRARGLSRNLGS
jgi:hypothetical protein